MIQIPDTEILSETLTVRYHFYSHTSSLNHTISTCIRIFITQIFTNSSYNGDRTSSQPILLSWLTDPIVMPDIRSTATQVTQCHNNVMIKFLTEQEIVLRHVIILHCMNKQKNLLTWLLTDGNSLEVDKVRHLLVVGNTTVLALIDTNTADTHGNNQWSYW